MDPVIATLGISLAESAARNGAALISDKIKSAKAKKNDTETIAKLEEIINDLIADKNEVTRIAHAYEQELVSQKITEKDIEYITNNLFPIVDQFTPESSKASITQIKSLLSVETLTIMQLIGFNYKRAIGEPLTVLLQKFIESKLPQNPKTNQELIATVANLVQNEEAFKRFQAITGTDLK